MYSIPCLNKQLRSLEGGRVSFGIVYIGEDNPLSLFEQNSLGRGHTHGS